MISPGPTRWLLHSRDGDRVQLVLLTLRPGVTILQGTS